jgi:succinyl-CoA synthetase alpha subunit
MSILIDQNTRLLVQGITGKDGSFQTERAIEYGTKVVAGVTPGKGGTSIFGVPIFNTVAEAVKQTGANASIIYVPAPFAADCIMEAIDAELPLVACITEGIPVMDEVAIHAYLKGKKTRLIGPNCSGVVSPGKSKASIIANSIIIPGPVGVVSRSGTLTYEVVSQLTALKLGQTTCVGIGGDPLPGTTFVEVLKMFEKDDETKAIVFIGEIGGTGEQDAAAYIKRYVTKPIVAFIAGATAPPGKRMGHAGAIISGSSGTAKEKIAALKAAGATVVAYPTEVAPTMKKVLGK